MIAKIKHLAYVLKIPKEELLRISQELDKYYYEKRQYKLDKCGNPKILKDGSPDFRILYPSTGRLKEIQKRINVKILQHYKCFTLSDYAHGAVKGRDNITNARKHQGKKFIFTTDLKKFFPSITHKKVFEMFVAKGFSSTVSNLLTKLTTYRGQLPQGAPTSSMLANLVFIKAGDELARYCSGLGVTFTSFIDDLTFSSPKCFQEHHQGIIKIIKDNGFRISYSKTHYKTKNPIVTGAIVKNNRLDVTPDFKDKIIEASAKMALGEDISQRIKGLQQYAFKINNA